MVQTPVLYITFARPEYASQSFAAIQKAKPKKLYFYSNKARTDRPDEILRNEEVRSYVQQIDWECEVKTWFREDYVDVFTSIWGAIDWIFENEEKAIVVEEDVVTCSAFYDYMESLLEKFKDNKKVWMLSGDNATPQYNPKGLSFFPSRFAQIYGWASWADRWHALDRRMGNWSSFRKSKAFNDYYCNFLQRKLQRAYFNKVYNNLDTYNAWDFIFNYNLALNDVYCIIPSVNLVADIGVAGSNHWYNMESPWGVIGIHSERFPFDNLGEQKTVKPTGYDIYYYYHIKFLGLIKRMLFKYLHIRLD